MIPERSVLGLSRAGEFLQEFVHTMRRCVSLGVLTRDILQDYTKAKASLHGMLQSAFVEAGWSVGWIPCIEPRVPLSVPFDPFLYNSNLSGRRKRHQFRPDVGYYRDGSCDVFAECCTTDEAGEYIPSNETAEYDPSRKGHITKRDALAHFLKHARPEVSRLVICVVLPHRMKRKPP